MAQCSSQDLLAAAKCFGCLDQRALLQAICALLCQLLQAKNPMANCDVQSLMTSGACFGCLDQRQLLMVIAQLLCENLQAGGAGNAVILCGTSDPVAPPPSNCAIYIRTDNGRMWYWDAINVAWVLFLG